MIGQLILLTASVAAPLAPQGMPAATGIAPPVSQATIPGYQPPPKPVIPDPNIRRAGQDAHQTFKQVTSASGVQADGKTNPYTGDPLDAEALLQRQRIVNALRDVLKSEIEVLRLQDMKREINLKQELSRIELERKINAAKNAPTERERQLAEQLARQRQQVQNRRTAEKRKPAMPYRYAGYVEENGQLKARIWTGKKFITLTEGQRVHKTLVEKLTREKIVLKNGNTRVTLKINNGDYRINRRRAAIQMPPGQVGQNAGINALQQLVSDTAPR